MPRICDFNSSGKTIATSTTVTFTSADIPGSNIVAYHVAMTGAGNTFNAIDRIRVKANGVTIYEITSGLFRSFVQRFTNGRVGYPANQAVPPPPGAAGTAVDWRRFTIPFCFLDREKSEEADVCQFPVGTQPTVEVVFNANAVAGSAFIGWTESDVTPRCWPKLYSSQANIPASQSNGRYIFSEDGVIRGLGFETTGLARARAVLNGRQVYHMKGQPANSTTVTEDDLILESEMLAGGRAYSGLAGTAFSDNSIVDPAWIKVTAGEDGTPGRTYFEAETTAAWVGVTSELGIYAIVPYGEQSFAQTIRNPR
jgi:hypothetical protein